MICYKKITSILNYIFIFLTINYNLFVRFIIKIDSTGYGLIFLSMIVLFMNLSNIINIQFRKPIVFWFIWCIYVFLNYYLHPHIHSLGIFSLYRKIFIPLITMIVIVIEYKKNHINILLTCLITHLSYMLLGYYFDPGILHRNLGVENELGNTYATTSSFILFYIALLNKYKKIKSVWTISIIIFVIVIIKTKITSYDYQKI